MLQTVSRQNPKDQMAQTSLFVEQFLKQECVIKQYHKHKQGMIHSFKDRNKEK